MVSVKGNLLNKTALRRFSLDSAELNRICDEFLARNDTIALWKKIALPID